MGKSIRGWLYQVIGDIAHDAADDGYPLKIGGKASTSEPSAVSNADRVNAYFDANGYLMVKSGATTAAIGKLAANSGVDIGDVDVTSTVHPAALSTVAVGERQGSATAVQLPTVTAKYVRIKAVISNVGNVYLGGSGVTKVDGTTDTTTGLELTPGDDTGWLPASNLNVFYIICDNAGDDITYMVLA